MSQDSQNSSLFSEYRLQDALIDERRENESPQQQEKKQPTGLCARTSDAPMPKEEEPDPEHETITGLLGDSRKDVRDLRDVLERKSLQPVEPKGKVQKLAHEDDADADEKSPGGESYQSQLLRDDDGWGYDKDDKYVTPIAEQDANGRAYLDDAEFYALDSPLPAPPAPNAPPAPLMMHAAVLADAAFSEAPPAAGVMFDPLVQVPPDPAMANYEAACLVFNGFPFAGTMHYLEAIINHVVSMRAGRPDSARTAAFGSLRFDLDTLITFLNEMRNMLPPVGGNDTDDDNDEEEEDDDDDDDDADSTSSPPHNAGP